MSLLVAVLVKLKRHGESRLHSKYSLLWYVGYILLPPTHTYVNAVSRHWHALHAILTSLAR